METKKQSVTRKQAIEEQNFEKFVQLKNINRYNYTSLSHPYDVKMQSGDTYCISEIKVRKDRDMEFFNKYGAYLELTKANGMWKEKEYIKEKNDVDVKMMYFNFASDGLQIYHLNEPWTYTFYWKYLPKDNFDPSIKVWKMVADLKNPVEQIKF